MAIRVATVAVVAATVWGVSAYGAESQAAGADCLRVHSVKEYGPTRTPREAEATFKKALDALTKGQGGILVVPEDVPQAANLENVARWSHSVDPGSCKLSDWKVGPGVLVVDNRGGTFTLHVAQLGGRAHQRGGITLERTLRLPPGDSLQHWTEEAVLSIENNVVHGPCNYMEWLEEPVAAGKDRRFYVPTARNLFKGMYLNAHHGPGYRGPVARITVKDIGWDAKTKRHYFVADTNTDHVRGAMMQNKSHTPAIRVESNLNASNQTFDIYVRRNQYGNGDSYIFDAWFNYMGNVHSMPGDENGVCYVAYIKSDCNVFRGQVKSADAKAGAVVFKRARFAHTLANSRPLINLNVKKWITRGKVVIVPPGDPTRPCEPIDEGRWTYQGKTYPSGVVKSAYKGLLLSFGGLIRGDKDCPWDESIVGRFFAVDEPSEYVKGAHGGGPKHLRRWYEIAELKRNADGTKDIKIKRYWWGAKAAASPTLYDPQNYTRDGRVRPLQYVIAPGAYVNNVSDAVGTPRQRQGKPPFTIGITPHTDAGTDRDFAPDDPIEQAIGADPFKPQGLRVWAFDAVPGAWPSAMIDLANFGPVARSRAITVHGGPTRIEDCDKRRERRPAWDTVLGIDAAATVGLACNADFADAAILFRQPNREQPIKWHYGERKPGKPVAKASLTVSNTTGEFVFDGAGVQTNGPVTKVQGLSANETPARNLRGKNVPVQAGATRMTVTFPAPEPDADYAVFVEQTWLTSRAVTGQTDTGFTVAFDKPAPDGAKLHWMIVR